MLFFRHLAACRCGAALIERPGEPVNDNGGVFDRRAQRPLWTLDRRGVRPVRQACGCGSANLAPAVRIDYDEFELTGGGRAGGNDLPVSVEQRAQMMPMPPEQCPVREVQRNERTFRSLHEALGSV